MVFLLVMGRWLMVEDERYFFDDIFMTVIIEVKCVIWIVRWEGDLSIFFVLFLSLSILLFFSLLSFRLLINVFLSLLSL